ncbi:replication initiation protein RepC [Paracoccus sp. CPCC 101403]|uniref:Replication initiation protein RepC n=2 Tax=Paracoccus broussonetiae TaxID=3075834 RepID=A0ABU3EK92_9RHOB|nr:replication initiation protein RepC [Paracoccus sp. CPCC 101403]
MHYPAPMTRPVLPEGMSLSHVLELVERVARHLHLGAARCTVLLRMMRQTAPADWLDPNRDPVCYRAQQDLAQELGITDRMLRLHEKGLEALGLIEIDTAANGRRSGRTLSNGRRLGINFRPMVEIMKDLLALDAEHRLQAHRISVLRLECSAAKRDAKIAIERLLETVPQHPALPKLLRRYTSWPRRYATFRCSGELEAHLAAIGAVLEEALGCLQCWSEISGRAEARVPTISNTILKILEGGGTRLPLADRAVSRSSPRGRANDRPDQDDLSWLTPEIVSEIASPDFRFCLEALRSSGPVNERVLRSTAIMLLRDLGITESAWEAALDQMGSLRAALAVLIIDANRSHPVTPTRSPGAMLRGFTTHDRVGDLDLSGALKSLLRRSRVAK